MEEAVPDADVEDDEERRAAAQDGGGHQDGDQADQPTEQVAQSLAGATRRAEHQDVADDRQGLDGDDQPEQEHLTRHGRPLPAPGVGVT